MLTLLFIVGVLVGLISVVIALYNKLVRLRNTVKSSWAQIDVQLKKRYDLLPNLVETVKGYAKHEKEVFSKVSDARERMMSGSREERVSASNELTATLKTLFAISE